MAKKAIFKLVVFVPQTHVEQVRIAICNAGAGKIGKYDNCTFMTSGIGTYRPLAGAKPYKGNINQLERVGEAKLETIIEKKYIKKVIASVKKVHPYEEPVIEFHELLNC